MTRYLECYNSDITHQTRWPSPHMHIHTCVVSLPVTVAPFPSVKVKSRKSWHETIQNFFTATDTDMTTTMSHLHDCSSAINYCLVHFMPDTIQRKQVCVQFHASHCSQTQLSGQHWLWVSEYPLRQSNHLVMFILYAVPTGRVIWYPFNGLST